MNKLINHGHVVLTMTEQELATIRLAVVYGKIELTCNAEEERTQAQKEIQANIKQVAEDFLRATA